MHQREWAAQIAAARVDQTHAPWDSVLLVILDDEFRVTGIWQAERDAIAAAIAAPGSKARIERGALAVSKFKSIGRKIWPT